LILRKNVRVLALFLFSQVFPENQPAPQSGDPRRTPKAAVPQELWTAVRITALTQEVEFSEDAYPSQKMSEFTPFFSFPKFSLKISPHPKAAILAALQSSACGRTSEAGPHSPPQIQLSGAREVLPDLSIPPSQVLKAAQLRIMA